MGACGSTLMKPCLGETDIRYDTAYPKTIVESVSFWGPVGRLQLKR